MFIKRIRVSSRGYLYILYMKSNFSFRIIIQLNISVDFIMKNTTQIQ